MKQQVPCSHHIARIFVFIVISAIVAEMSFAHGMDAARRNQYRRIRQDQIKRMRENKRRRSLVENLNIQKDVVYGTEYPQRQSLDLYVPKDAKEPLPLIVWIHGGGWRGGSKDNCRALGLTEHGYAVASINYRLTDAATFPAQIHDCKAAIRYLRANAKKNNIDPDRIGVWGGSAGGHLVALLGVTNGNKALEGTVGRYPKTSSDVQAVCDWFGPTDMTSTPERQRRHKDDKGPIVLLLGGEPAEKSQLAKQASPAAHVSKEAVPFLIMHGKRDNLVPYQQSQLLHEKLKAAGADSTLILFDKKGHGFGQEPEVLEPVMNFFERTLKDKSKLSSDGEKKGK